MAIKTSGTSISIGWEFLAGNCCPDAVCGLESKKAFGAFNSEGFY
jgi:hypothetical protein